MAPGFYGHPPLAVVKVFCVKPGAKLQQARLIGASDAVNRRRELQLLRASVGDLDPPLTFEDGTRRLRKLRGGGHLASVIRNRIAAGRHVFLSCLHRNCRFNGFSAAEERPGFQNHIGQLQSFLRYRLSQGILPRSRLWNRSAQSCRPQA